MASQQYPAECVCGPWDGKQIIVTHHTIIMHSAPAHSVVDYLAADKIQPIKYHTGCYRVRIHMGNFVLNSQGCYLFDWQGWQS